MSVLFCIEPVLKIPEELWDWIRRLQEQPDPRSRKLGLSVWKTSLMGWQTLWEVGVAVSMPSSALYIYPPIYPQGSYSRPLRRLFVLWKWQLIYGCKSEGWRLGKQLQKSLSPPSPGYNNWLYFYDRSPGSIKSRGGSLKHWMSKCLSISKGTLRRWKEWRCFHWNNASNGNFWVWWVTDLFKLLLRPKFKN